MASTPMEAIFFAFFRKKLARFKQPPYFCGVILYYYTINPKHFAVFCITAKGKKRADTESRTSP